MQGPQKVELQLKFCNDSACEVYHSVIHIDIVFFPFSSVDSAPSVSGLTQPVSAQRKPLTRTGVTMKNDLSCLSFPFLQKTLILLVE